MWVGSCENLPGLDALDAIGDEGIVGLSDGVRQVDGAGGVFNDEALESEGGAVDGGVTDAEVVGQSAEEQSLQAALAQIPCKAGRGEVVVLEEGRVGVDVATKAFAEDQLGVGNVECRMEASAGGILQAVFGPERLRAVRSLDGLEGLLVMRGGEGDVLDGMPVLGEDNVVELLREGVDEGDDLIAVGYGEVAAYSVDCGAEVVLYVDDEQSVVRLEGDRHGSLIVPLQAKWRRLSAV